MATAPTPAQYALPLLSSFWKVKFLEFAVMKNFLLDPVHSDGLGWHQGERRIHIWWVVKVRQVFTPQGLVDNVRHPLQDLYLYLKEYVCRSERSKCQEEYLVYKDQII